ncbi:uncharacterized protein LOC141900257 [Tubulanus polymorphus]|uniref:uncharacterized protein LOC141900257 n=1 Tax=Tubulanus polymorphus TaxID=672921 RepID=UPI003DA4DB75
MASLVADYGSESDSDANQEDTPRATPVIQKSSPVKAKCEKGAAGFFDGADEESSPESESEAEEDEDEAPLSPTSQIRLPSAHQVLEAGQENTIQNSIYSNPYTQAEAMKNSVLEKHVKLTVADVEKGKARRGKKLPCRQFMRGHCRYGTKCQFVHVINNKPNITADNSVEKESSQPQFTEDIQSYDGEYVYEQNNEDDDSYMNIQKRKKRHGISDRLQPPKKAMKDLDRQRESERPWTIQ